MKYLEIFILTNICFQIYNNEYHNHILLNIYIKINFLFLIFIGSIIFIDRKKKIKYLEYLLYGIFLFIFMNL